MPIAKAIVDNSISTETHQRTFLNQPHIRQYPGRGRGHTLAILYPELYRADAIHRRKREQLLEAQRTDRMRFVVGALTSIFTVLGLAIWAFSAWFTTL